MSSIRPFRRSPEVNSGCAARMLVFPRRISPSSRSGPVEKVGSRLDEDVQQLLGDSRIVGPEIPKAFWEGLPNLLQRQPRQPLVQKNRKGGQGVFRNLTLEVHVEGPGKATPDRRHQEDLVGRHPKKLEPLQDGPLQPGSQSHPQLQGQKADGPGGPLNQTLHGRRPGRASSRTSVLWSSALRSGRRMS